MVSNGTGCSPLSQLDNKPILSTQYKNTRTNKKFVQREKDSIDGNEVVLHLAGSHSDHYSGSGQGPFQRACPAVACKDDYASASAALAWVEVLLVDLEPSLQKTEGLHTLLDQACTERCCTGGQLMVVVAPRLRVAGSSSGQQALCNLYSGHC